MAILPLSAALAADFGSLSGTVVDAGGRGVANVVVKLGFDGKSDTRRTGPDGSYSFLELLPGKYTVSIAPPEGQKLTTAATVSVTVQAKKAAGANFGLAKIIEPTPTPKPTLQPTATPVVSPAAVSKPTGTAQAGTVPVVVAKPESVAKPEGAMAVAEAGGARAADGTASRPGPAPSPAALFGPNAGLATLGPPPAAEGNDAAVADAAAERTAAGEKPKPASAEDILAGRGLHWTGPRLAFEPASSGSPNVVAAASVAAQGGSERAAVVRPIVSSLQPLRRAAAQIRAWASDSALWLGVPFRTQIDGTDYAAVNCGPASLAMVLAGFGMPMDPAVIRDYVNFLTGDYDTDDGTGLDVLARVAAESGLNTFGLYAAGGYRTWSVEDVRQHVRAGHPVITLTKYRSLPGHAGSLAEFDHYVVITGLSGDDFIYNDAAFASDYGFNLLISADDLQRAWGYSSIPGHAVAVGLGNDLRPLPNAPRGLGAASLAGGPRDAIDGVGMLETVSAEPPLSMVPGRATQWLRERMLARGGAGAAPSTGEGATEERAIQERAIQERADGDATGLRAPAEAAPVAVQPLFGVAFEFDTLAVPTRADGPGAVAADVLVAEPVVDAAVVDAAVVDAMVTDVAVDSLAVPSDLIFAPAPTDRRPPVEFLLVVLAVVSGLLLRRYRGAPRA